MKPEKNWNERNSSGITEPVGAGKSSGESVFVIQKHDSKKLHWDLRLQMGVYSGDGQGSWCHANVICNLGQLCVSWR